VLEEEEPVEASPSAPDETGATIADEFMDHIHNNANEEPLLLPL